MFPRGWTKRQRLVRGLNGVLFMMAATIGLAEAALYWLDPLGITDLYIDQARIVTIANAEGYTLAPGQHELRRWSFTIDDAGNRVMPMSNGVCRIVFIGDSVTFGAGVNDEQSFAYLFALDHPDIAFVNAAKIAYNIANVTASIGSHPADGYIYLISDNDDGLPWARPESDWGKRRELPAERCALCYHFNAFYQPPLPVVVDSEAFWDSLAGLTGRDAVLMAALGSPLGDEIAARYPSIPLIPRWSYDQQISWFDGHPNAAGHVYLLNALQEIMTDFVTKRCGV
jgi:hypothetical protein